jgi:hypothetical protein
MSLLIARDLPVDAHRNGERESRTFAHLGLNPHATAVHLNNALSDGQAKAVPALLCTQASDAGKATPSRRTQAVLSVKLIIRVLAVDRLQ